MVAENPVSIVKRSDDLARTVDPTDLSLERRAGRRIAHGPGRNIEHAERAARPQEAMGLPRNDRNAIKAQGRRIDKRPYNLACVVDPRRRAVGSARRINRAAPEGCLTHAEPRRAQPRARGAARATA